MYHRLVALCWALVLSVGTSQAETVGPFNFDNNAFADGAAIAATVAGTRGPAVGVASAADGNLASAANLNDSFVELFFTDNVLINGAGDDIVIFTNTNNNTVRLTTASTTAVPWVTGISTFIASGEPGNTSGFSLSGQSIDLSDLGFADGAEVTDGLFIYGGGVFTTVWDVAALNSGDAGPTDPPPNPVPLPAGFVLLLGGLGALSLARRKRV
ncbi:VPLPA-CTERM sorting domain-containing protein [Jannaschia sp. CCS1]|uniref:VPLPA-CTERM sorting domain-containing protein n=1 Tax=Jannaschia sp. (strain CCS1) TaxID=290400 RepID=UPI000053DB8A|nr:VPLPA-CTERM sorting domain-containing protein [Jannaschia sp. CCS1]ABD53636.1 hypothetical protein Jann_0719 [Jannaschia sp. CCS1]